MHTHTAVVYGGYLLNSSRHRTFREESLRYTETHTHTRSYLLIKWCGLSTLRAATARLTFGVALALYALLEVWAALGTLVGTRHELLARRAPFLIWQYTNRRSWIFPWCCRHFLRIMCFQQECWSQAVLTFWEQTLTLKKMTICWINEHACAQDELSLGSL